jgi:AcrR family transcriptional regulator
MSTKDTILTVTVPLLANHGYAGTGMRAVAEAAQVQTSVIYHYFPTKDDLLREVRFMLNASLDEHFDNAPAVQTAQALLRQRLYLNFKHIEAVVALLQYFMASRRYFAKVDDGGYVPQRAYRHMHEIINRGIAEGAYATDDPVGDAKILAHMVNGFLLEYYGHRMTRQDTDTVVNQLASFIERALQASR